MCIHFIFKFYLIHFIYRKEDEDFFLLLDAKGNQEIFKYLYEDRLIDQLII
jgi:hypothetical protein